MADRMPTFSPWPDGTMYKPTGAQRRAHYYHGFHDTLDADCLSCAWEQHI